MQSCHFDCTENRPKTTLPTQKSPVSASSPSSLPFQEEAASEPRAKPASAPPFESQKGAKRRDSLRRPLRKPLYTADSKDQILYALVFFALLLPTDCTATNRDTEKAGFVE